MSQTRREPDMRDEYDILSAIWILACNDENPMITFGGVAHRLDLADEAATRALVLRRGQLFRRRIPDQRLAAWKQQMSTALERRPSWIRALNGEAAQLAAIHALTPEDGFRSQFRPDSGAPTSSLDVVDWGLQHLDRLRRAKADSSEQKLKRWQLWSVIGLGIMNLALTLSLNLLK